MKNFFLILLFSSFLGLFGCSSLELESISSSKEETQRILSLGLTHEENLIEASKLKTPHMVSVVSLQLTNARDEKIQAKLDNIEANKFADLVITSQDKTEFTGPEITNLVKTGILAIESDIQSFYLRGLKDINNGSVSHQLYVSISHNSKAKRHYISANFCDKWNRCDENKKEIFIVSENASNCSNYNCDFKEIFKMNLNSEVLKSSLNKGLIVRFNSENSFNKVSISAPYLIGYFKVVK
tara:strand:- start:151 stop:870 length:720 start_codon:yes stop_codon:yes gene_type:complete